MNRPPETIQVVCPRCQATESVSAGSVGSTITCSNCLEDFSATPLAKRPTSSTPPRKPTDSPDADNQALQRLLNPSVDAAHNTLRLEDDLSGDDYPTKKRQVLERDYDFSVACVICGTRLDVNDSLIGKKIKCPDCHSAIAVRTPPPERRRQPVPAQPVASDDDDDFGLAAASDPSAARSPYHSIADELVAKAEAEVARESLPAPRPTAPRPPAADALQRAGGALDKTDEQQRPKLPAAPFRTGVLKFLLDPLTIARLIVLGLVLFVELGAIQSAIVSADGGAQSQFLSILFRMFAIPMGVVLATNLAVSLLGILQDTTNGKDAIESWPDVNFLDWLGEALYVFSGLFMAVFPACVLAQLLGLFGAPDRLVWLVCILGCSVGILFLFPFALVSMLESASPVLPISQPIFRSLRLARGSWLVFMLLSSLVFAAGLGLGAIRVLWPQHAVMNFAVALLLIILLAVYFRLLGRLTWCCDEAILAEDIRLEEAAEANENRA